MPSVHYFLMSVAAGYQIGLLLAWIFLGGILGKGAGRWNNLAPYKIFTAESQKCTLKSPSLTSFIRNFDHIRLWIINIPIILYTFRCSCDKSSLTMLSTVKYLILYWIIWILNWTSNAFSKEVPFFTKIIQASWLIENIFH